MIGKLFTLKMATVMSAETFEKLSALNVAHPRKPKFHTANKMVHIRCDNTHNGAEWAGERI
jgi:hypothetical protein